MEEKKSHKNKRLIQINLNVNILTVQENLWTFSNAFSVSRGLCGKEKVEKVAPTSLSGSQWWSKC